MCRLPRCSCRRKSSTGSGSWEHRTYYTPSVDWSCVSGPGFDFAPRRPAPVEIALNRLQGWALGTVRGRRDGDVLLTVAMAHRAWFASCFW
jgi:hypothetical protein